MADFVPHNTFVQSLLTDRYQLTMSYAYWKAGRHEEYAVFETFFRKNPFKGEFTIFAGLEEVLRYASSFKFTDSDIEYLKSTFPAGTDQSFFEWLAKVDCRDIKLYAVHEGSVVFPRIPLIRVEGPLAVAQLLETCILNLTNFASLIATNARRMRLAAGEDKTLLEFGLRRSQGPDGAISASRYAFIGGFDGTSNCLASKLFDISCSGTQAHSFVSSYQGRDDLHVTELDGKEFWEPVLAKRSELGFDNSSVAELSAFVSYAIAFPSTFLALVDTYDTLESGVPNFVCVALTLQEFGYTAIGIRLDSGDLAYLSRCARKVLHSHGLGDSKIVASNDINEPVLHSLQKQGHEIDSFGIGTNLVTCQAQPALGMVFKLVEVKGRPCLKFSNEFEKTTLPGRKRVFRLIGQDSVALCDLMIHDEEDPPKPGERIFCQHPFQDRKRCFVKPCATMELLELVFDGKVTCDLPSIAEIRKFSTAQVMLLREDQVRALNPTDYKVSVSKGLYEKVKTLWSDQAPIPELS